MELSPTVAFDYPTIATLAEYIASNLTIAQLPGGDLDSRVTLHPASWCLSDISSDISCPSGSQASPMVLIEGVAGTIPGAASLSSIPVDSASGKDKKRECFLLLLLTNYLLLLPLQPFLWSVGM